MQHTGVDPGFSEGGSMINAWPHGHVKGEGGAKRGSFCHYNLLLPTLAMLVCLNVNIKLMH